MTESAHQARLKLFRAPAPWKGVWGKPFEHRSRHFKLDLTPKGGHLPLPVVDLYPPFFVFPWSVVPFFILICTLGFHKGSKIRNAYDFDWSVPSIYPENPILDQITEWSSPGFSRFRWGTDQKGITDQFVLYPPFLYTSCSKINFLCFTRSTDNSFQEGYRSIFF